MFLTRALARSASRAPAKADIAQHCNLKEVEFFRSLRSF